MINLAATPTAITAGSLPASSGSPIGEVIMEIAASEWPAAARLWRNRDHFALEPISPMVPNRSARIAASQSAKSSA